jgi:hypothetical protein
MRPSFVAMSPDHGCTLSTLRHQRRQVTKGMCPAVPLPGCTGPARCTVQAVSDS